MRFMAAKTPTPKPLIDFEFLDVLGILKDRAAFEGLEGGICWIFSGFRFSGSGGTEHVGYAAFKPARAAAWVRKQTLGPKSSIASPSKPGAGQAGSRKVQKST